MLATNALSELLLSSTAATSPLPTTQLHSLTTGSLVFSFKSPHASTTSTISEQDVSVVGYRKTMGFVESANGCGGIVLGLGGKEGRAGINVWGFQKEQVLQRLIPPVRLSTLCLSKTGNYLAGGTADGRIFFWEISSGTLLLTIDAHYRPVSVLEFSHDDACLVSAGEDGGVSVWSVGRLLNSSPMAPPTPFAILTDHTLAVSAVAIGLGTFPRCRILTASLDNTCKIWDITTSPASLLTTFSFPSPITHVVWDSLERFFFAACTLPRTPTMEKDADPGSKIVKINLYKKREIEVGYDTLDAVGGGGRGEVEAAVEVGSYIVADTITALHLSVHSPTLILGTSTSTIHVLALLNLLPTRIIPPPLSSTPPGPITFLSTMIRPPDLGAGTAEGVGAGGVALPARVVMSGNMGRSAKGMDWTNGGKSGRTVSMRVGKSLDVRDLLDPGMLLLLVEDDVNSGNRSDSGSKGSNSGGVQSGGQSKSPTDGKALIQIAALEEEVLKLRGQLGKAVAMNDTLWKKVVDGSLKPADNMEGVEAQR